MSLVTPWPAGRSEGPPTRLCSGHSGAPRTWIRLLDQAQPYGALLRDLWSMWRCSRSFTAHCYWADRPAGLLAMPDLYRLVRSVLFLDVVLLVFNMLPIYPLDGGQILRSLLWFVIGRGRSLLVATSLGFLGVAGFIGLAVWRHSLWYAALAFFMLMNCWSGLQHARALLQLAKLPRRSGYQCPNCRTAPPVGIFLEMRPLRSSL